MNFYLIFEFSWVNYWTRHKRWSWIVLGGAVHCLHPPTDVQFKYINKELTKMVENIFARICNSHYTGVTLDAYGVEGNSALCLELQLYFSKPIFIDDPVMMYAEVGDCTIIYGNGLFIAHEVRFDLENTRWETSCTVRNRILIGTLRYDITTFEIILLWMTLKFEKSLVPLASS